MDESEVVAIERAVTRVLLRYAHAVDRRDYEGVAACYWPDATDRHATFDGDAVAYVAWLREVLPGIETSTHQFTNILVEVVSADEATSETYCCNVLVHPGRERDGRVRQTTAHLRYLDRFARRGAEWRVIAREVVTDWSRDELVRPFVR